MSPFSLLESLAVVLAIGYLLLAARESLWCWACAFVSSAIYTTIFWDVELLMESLLNVFYVVMAVVGWQQWRQGSRTGEPLQIQRLPAWQHAAMLLGLVLMSLASGWYLENFTNAAWPVLDSFTTWGAALTTFLVVRKVLENWLYWFVIDGISIFLYIDRGLYQTALLFVAYEIIVVFGFFHWLNLYREQDVTAPLGTAE